MMGDLQLLVKPLVALAVSFVAVMIIMPHWIDFLKKKSFNQTVSEYSLEEYKEKAKTPIMGGVVFILVPVIVTYILDFKGAIQPDILVVVLTFIGYGAIGFIDDFLIIARHNNDGLSPKKKFGLQVLLAIIVFLFYRSNVSLSIHVPFTDVEWNLGIFYFFLILFMFAGSSNAVNLTDGMDGLSSGCMQFSLVAFFILAYVEKNATLLIFIAALIGALFGYLYYNVAPAKIFMGDTGSLALGAVLAAIAMVLKKELALVVIGGTFVIETLCVILQISSVKIRHKRIFPYTPIHYAFRIKGMPEKSIVRMFYLVSLIFAVLGVFVGMH